MANNMMTLLTTAAELRSGGVSWEMIGAVLSRSANTCRQWPNRYPEEWKNLYAQAEEERWKEAGHEAVATLRRLLQDENPRIQIQSASHLIKWSMFHKKLEVQQGIDPNRTYYDVNHFIAEEEDSLDVPLSQRTQTESPIQHSPGPPTSTFSSVLGATAACLLLLLCFSWQGFLARSDGRTPNHSMGHILDSGWEKQDRNQIAHRKDDLVACSVSNTSSSALQTLDFPVEQFGFAIGNVQSAEADRTAFDTGQATKFSFSVCPVIHVADGLSFQSAANHFVYSFSMASRSVRIASAQMV